MVEKSGIANLVKELDFGDHICLLYNKVDEYREIALAYILEGLLKHEKVMCITREYPKDLMIRDLNDKNIDVNHYIESGQLVISNLENMYVGTDGFNPDEALTNWKHKLNMIKKEKFVGVRILAEMTFVLYEDDGLNKLVEYELKCNQHDNIENQLYLCAFNKNEFPNCVLEDMVKKHRVLINEGELIKPNPYYITYEKQLEEYRNKRTMKEHLSLQGNNHHDTISIKNYRENREATILKHVLGSTGDGVWEWNVKSNQVYLNKGFFNTLGYYNEQTSIEIEKLMKLVHPEERYAFKKKVRECYEDEMKYIDHEVRVKSNEGEWIWFLVRGAVIAKDATDGSVLKMVGMFTDITERKKIKSKLDEKEHFENLRTDFFSNISHELRTPLNVILGSLQLQELYIKSDITSKFQKEYSKANKRMKQNSYRLLRLVNNIIDITKIDSGFYHVHLENYDISILIRKIVLSVDDYVSNAGLSIEYQTDVEQAIIACDPEKIERIMLNLLSNAIKFTESGGQILVSLEALDDKILISIKDTGVGIPQDMLDRVFERFKQVGSQSYRKNEGSGIGLSLVKLLVEAHEGKISVRSRLKKGTEFIIELPMKSIIEEECVKEEVASTREVNVERLYIEFSDIYV